MGGGEVSFGVLVFFSMGEWIAWIFNPLTDESQWVGGLGSLTRDRLNTIWTSSSSSVDPCLAGGRWWLWWCDAEEATTLTMLGGITKHHPEEGSPNIINEKNHQTNNGVDDVIRSDGGL